MEFPAHTHTVSTDEISQIKAMGFDILGNVSAPENFVNTHFANFDLFTFLQKINIVFSTIHVGTVNKYIHLYDNFPPRILVEYYSDNHADSDKGLAFSRIFTVENGEIIVNHDYFSLPKSFRKTGLSKEISKISFQQYVNMGISKILVYAALQDGGLVWAKNFFLATNRNEVDVILHHARLKVTTVQYLAVVRVYNNYYDREPSGTAFPIQKWSEMSFMEDVLKGSDWHGAVDFKNQEQFRNFRDYVVK